MHTSGNNAHIGQQCVPPPPPFVVQGVVREALYSAWPGLTKEPRGAIDVGTLLAGMCACYSLGGIGYRVCGHPISGYMCILQPGGYRV